MGYNAGSGAFQDAIRMTTEGYVQRPDQPFIRCYGNSGSRVTTHGSTVTFNNWAVAVNRGITHSSGTFTAPVAGEYLVTYSFYLWMDNAGHGVNHSVYFQVNNSHVQENISEIYHNMSAGSYLFDNTISNSIVVSLGVGDTFRFRVYADIYGGAHHTNMSAYLL